MMKKQKYGILVIGLICINCMKFLINIKLILVSLQIISGLALLASILWKLMITIPMLVLVSIINYIIMRRRCSMGSVLGLAENMLLLSIRLASLYKQ